MTARVVALGQPANDAERRTIAFLRDNLPDGYVLLHNFELVRHREVFEIDLAILAPHSVFVVDIKGTRGQIDIYGPRWHPAGRAPYHSPLAKLRDHARALKTLICDTFPTQGELRRVYIHAAVLMASPDARVVDHSGRDGPDVVYLQRSLAYFQGRTHIPANFTSNIAPLLGQIERAISGNARGRSGPLCFREWEVTERLGGNARYSEYRVRHVWLRERERTARLRVYPVDPLAAAPERDSERNRISNAFQALSRLPSHPNIIGVRDFFGTDDDDAFVLVTEDIPGPALRQVLNKPELARTFDQKVRIIQDILAALDHAHSHGVVHRNLTPDAIIVGGDGAARLTAFDYARVGEDRTNTIASEITEELDPAYQAPECYRAPQRASPAADLFAAGLIGYELLAGQPAFTGHTDLAERQTVFATPPSALRPELPSTLDDWLQRLCAFEPSGRPASAGEALREFQSIVARSAVPEPAPVAAVSVDAPVDFRDLPVEYRLADRFVIQERLGKGKFGVVYKVFDTFADIECALKLITYDRISTLDRLRQEYRALSHLPEHPNVVNVIWADRFTSLSEQQMYYIVMEYIDGLTVQEFIEAQALSWEDARTIAQQTADGLAHLHRHKLYHQDIKPSNLMWTDKGVRIIDFNVALTAEELYPQGATLRYLPPDAEPSEMLDGTPEQIDRDLYALGVTFYLCVTGQHPYLGTDDMLRSQPRDPREIPECEELDGEWAKVLLKAVARYRAQRFGSADEFQTALKALPAARRDLERGAATADSTESSTLGSLIEPTRPNVNPFVSHLLTLYSQSRKTNAGTRGLDEIGEATYVPTLLDQELLPAVLDGEFRLVIITGNAGDGKTAFIQKLERHERVERASFQRSLNGARFVAGGRTFLSNYDGSQDEGEKTNDQVLLEFFAPFAGNDPDRWPADQTRLIAINEGRLYDFLTTQRERFPRLVNLVRDGLAGRPTGDGVAVINLNLRAVVADTAGDHSSIFDRLIRRLVEPRFWQACLSCDLRDRCYIHHNARTFMDPVAGPRVIERLKSLYTLTHLRGRLHITLRDLRSALAYTLVGMYDCDEVHNLYLGTHSQRQQRIADGFYFNAWCGGSTGSNDRLLTLLRQIDVGETSNPDLDRSFDFLEPQAREMARFSFQARGESDDELHTALFSQLQRQFNRQEQVRAVEQHQRYVAMMRRRYYFERRDDLRDDRRSRRRPSMLPYRNAERFLELVGMREHTPAEWADETQTLLRAVNRGEGLSNPDQLGARLALRVRQVERGTARSYRLFDGSAFTLRLPSIGDSARFVEYLPQGLIFSCRLPHGRDAELRVNLDIYELLMRLNDGYRPSIEEIEGFYRTLAVFKNVLASAPYEEVMLAEEGSDRFFRLRRETNGVLVLEPVTEAS